ncbi:MAG TPA: 5-methylcytosine-specific restriction endonuclease system specificity protein McrC [Burkholderiaceae bacterium]|nr:5-methylcytosine-specific restriction endonuclease system specificity protein McrC [Burkholderiaceae bacterium]
MSSAIPIRNIYFLLCYAWNRLAEKDFVDVSTAGVTELADLFARVLITGVNRLCRKGLERGYLEHEAEIASVRGKVNLVETHMRFLDRHGRASCQFDELSHDTPQNRVIKAAMRSLALVEGLDRDHRGRLRRLARQLTDVADVPLSRDLFRSVNLHANNRHYTFLIDVARLIHRCAIPDEETGKYRFRDFLRDRREMARLFEGFIFNFLRTERSDLRVSREVLSWDASSDDDPDLTYLPDMRTDVSVRSDSRTTIIDAKYYEQTLQQYHDRRSLHSSHLYQLMSYLKNLEMRGGVDGEADGILVYPVVNEPLDKTYSIQGHQLRVFTLNLGAEWRRIEVDMRRLV